MEPQISFLEVKKSDFKSVYNVDYRNREQKTEKRGGQPYSPPIGWYRYSLNVVDKYPRDKLWLAKRNVDGEWPVCYVHTDTNVINSIEKKNSVFRSADLNGTESVQERGPKKDKNGYYEPISGENGIYPQYIKKLSVEGANKRYRLVFQCRFEPNACTTLKTLNSEDFILRVNDPEAIRPYGILIKKGKNA